MSRNSVKERREVGREARRGLPRSAHADWSPPADRPDPVSLLEAQNEARVPWLVPVRHSRMSVSPFTFYRGTARIMACDLASVPESGLEVQLVGDGHLSNFGAYASPGRQLVFDANDFDETLRGPFEWDVKRLAASFLIAARHRGFSDEEARTITGRAVEAYRTAMREFGNAGFLELWYDHTAVDDLDRFGDRNPKKLAKELEIFERKARSKNSLQALDKLTIEVDGRFQFRADRPTLVPVREVHADLDPEQIEQRARGAFADYLATIRDDRRFLLERYELIDIALKVVGVGSVGTHCYALLLQGRDEGDPLFLQVKEAGASVLEEYRGQSAYPHHGQRVVSGQRMIQAESDIFLGWATAPGSGQSYIRQLRDWKGSVEIERAKRKQLRFYASLCGHVLARGHARSGDPIAIAAYMGSSTRFDEAIVSYSDKYAHQTVADFEAFQTAILDGRLAVSDEV